MEMRPTILRYGPYGEDKSIDLVVERARMIGNREPDIGRAVGLDNVTFRTRVLDSHIFRRARDDTGFFDGGSWMNNDFAPDLERFHARSFVCFDFIVSPTDVGPIVRGKPANGQTVDKYMRLLAQIENGNSLARSHQQELKTNCRELYAARSIEIGRTFT